MVKEQISDTKPDNSSRKDFPKKGSLTHLPTPEEQKAWDNGGKQAVMAAIQKEHRKTQAYVARQNGVPFYIDKRGNGSE